ncbi:hypothetical protein FRC02_005369 [Tulasnella sp. 418]|nr:hypothetical protein FRC02_005369 [Tulasnella sp. 418]
MSYYSYYQQQPQWGTQQYQPVAPPRPLYQPQPNWGGRHYYRAQAGLDYDDYDRDDGFFDSVWSRVKDVFSNGVGKEEARHWHRRVYGGLVQMDSLEGREIGAAAGYEAVRHWSTYKSTYRQPLADDRDREREALAGLAIGEATKLLGYVRYQPHKHFRRETAEVAAATAERIFEEDYDDPYSAYESSSHRRRSSFGGDAYRRRRASSIGYSQQRPIVATSTGGTYMTAQPSGVSYVSSSHTGQPYIATTNPTAYAQPYVAATQPVQYVTTGQSYTGQSYVQPQPTYVSAAPTSPVAYTTTGQSVLTLPTGGVAFPQQQQQPYVTYAQPQSQVYPAGYSRSRHRSTGYGGGYVYR